MIGTRIVEGLEALTLAASAEGGVEAAFVPGAGMAGCSLRHRGEELLGQRAGLEAYVTERKTMGIPLLHPWANRISRRRFEVAGHEVAIDPEAIPMRLDPGGLPLHGLLAAAEGWRVERHEATADGGLLEAGFDFAARAELMAAFPFAHELRYEARLDGAALTITLTVRATGDAPVPIAFGFHPYLRLGDVERADWEVEIPVRERLELDASMLPTGERSAAAVPAGRLRARTFDDAFVAPPGGEAFVLAGGARRIALAFLAGYPYAQVYAPADDDVIAFEPMTAPTDALVSGSDLTLLAPGDSYRAAFSITVTDTGEGRHGSLTRIG
jgi:aldose 1-epimerase